MEENIFVICHLKHLLYYVKILSRPQVTMKSLRVDLGGIEECCLPCIVLRSHHKYPVLCTGLSYSTLCWVHRGSSILTPPPPIAV